MFRASHNPLPVANKFAKKVAFFCSIIFIYWLQWEAIKAISCMQYFMLCILVLVLLYKRSHMFLLITTAGHDYKATICSTPKKCRIRQHFHIDLATVDDYIIAVPVRVEHFRKNDTVTCCSYV